MGRGSPRPAALLGRATARSGLDADPRAQAAPPRRRDAHDPARLAMLDPTAREAAVGDRRAEAAGQVVAGLGPVLARARERAAPAPQGGHIDAELVHRRGAVGGE